MNQQDKTEFKQWLDEGKEMTKIEVMQKINQLLDSKCEEPAAEMIKLGEVMIEIGKALENQSPAEARAILKATAYLTAGE